jgi:hypothetical protein
MHRSSWQVWQALTLSLEHLAGLKPARNPSFYLDGKVLNHGPAKPDTVQNALACRGQNHALRKP